jgi:hypothetical protein
MTATLTAPAPSISAPVSARTVTERSDAAPHLEWTAVDSVKNTVWLGRVRGAFVGMVEERGDEFTVTTRLGRSLGTYPTLAEAQDAFIKR